METKGNASIDRPQPFHTQPHLSHFVISCLYQWLFLFVWVFRHQLFFPLSCSHSWSCENPCLCLTLVCASFFLFCHNLASAETLSHWASHSGKFCCSFSQVVLFGLPLKKRRQNHFKNDIHLQFLLWIILSLYFIVLFFLSLDLSNPTVRLPLSPLTDHLLIQACTSSF